MSRTPRHQLENINQDYHLHLRILKILVHKLRSFQLQVLENFIFKGLKMKFTSSHYFKNSFDFKYCFIYNLKNVIKFLVYLFSSDSFSHFFFMLALLLSKLLMRWQDECWKPQGSRLHLFKADGRASLPHKPSKHHLSPYKL